MFSDTYFTNRIPLSLMYIYYYKIFPDHISEKEDNCVFFANGDDFEKVKRNMDKCEIYYKVILDLWIDEDDYNTEDLKEEIIHELSYKDEVDDLFTIFRIVKNYRNEK